MAAITLFLTAVLFWPSVVMTSLALGTHEWDKRDVRGSKPLQE
jgi:hypothetical protein